MDGAVPITPAIAVGESFSYELEFPDTGVFWYHPHVREDYQQEMGLYGNMIVEEDGYWNEADQEEYLIVDDILEDGDFTEGVVTNTLMGRFGDTLLINDKEDYNFTVKQGEITRAYITNVANTRTFQLEFEGALMKLVGGDVGRIEKEEIIFLLTPTIIKDERMWEMGRDSLELVEAVRVGVRAGLLPFSREQITANYNRDAIDAYRIGDLEKALYWSNLSLHSASLQPEMIQLRQRITDEKASVWEQELRRELIMRESNRLSTAAEVPE